MQPVAVNTLVNHRLRRDMHLAGTLCGVGLWICWVVCGDDGDAGLVGVSAVGVKLTRSSAVRRNFGRPL
jgi:hypothetical protein